MKPPPGSRMFLLSGVDVLSWMSLADSLRYSILLAGPLVVTRYAWPLSGPSRHLGRMCEGKSAMPAEMFAYERVRAKSGFWPAWSFGKAALIRAIQSIRGESGSRLAERLTLRGAIRGAASVARGCQLSIAPAAARPDKNAPSM